MTKRTYRSDALSAALRALKEADKTIELEINRLKAEQEAVRSDIKDTETKLGLIIHSPQTSSVDIFSQQDSSKLTPPTTLDKALNYSPHMTWDEKILYILNLNKGSFLTSPAIYEELSSIDENLRTDEKDTKRKIMKRVSGALYNLATENKITKVTSSENQYIYSVK